MKRILFLSLLINCLPFFAQVDNIKPLHIGEVVTLKSTILAEHRILNIYLPEGYDTESDEKYPVIYLLDGSMNEDFLHVAGLVQFFNLQLQMPKTIVVGIANLDRKHDFTFPTTIEDLKKIIQLQVDQPILFNLLKRSCNPLLIHIIKQPLKNTYLVNRLVDY